MSERIKLTGLTPQCCIFLILKSVIDDFEPLMGFHVIDDSSTPFQRIDVILGAVGMYIGRLGRLYVGVAILCRAFFIIDVFIDQFERDLAVSSP